MPRTTPDNPHAASRIRPPAVAGLFYPDTAADLRAAVDDYLAHSESVQPAPKAIIAPHAGYIFSASVAASAYAGWQGLGDSVRRVVVLGPSHRVYLRGMALPAAGGFRTPLGTVGVDQQAHSQLAALAGMMIDDTPHAAEHSIEVQLPFLQVLFSDFELVPIVVGDAPAEMVAAVLEQLWGGDETRIVISTDLSHYHRYETARDIDKGTAASICALQYEAIEPGQACGCMPLRGLLYHARQHGLQVDELARCNSGDTAGPRDHVVGYGAYTVREPA